MMWDKLDNCRSNILTSGHTGNFKPGYERYGQYSDHAAAESDQLITSLITVIGILIMMLTISPR